MNTTGQLETPKRIIVIDDNEKWCEIVKIMATNLGYRVDFVGNPTDAYKLMEKAVKEGAPFRIAVVDMRFEMDEFEVSLGRDVIKTIKDNFPQTACILSSGENFKPKDILDLRDDYGLDYYLAKTDINRDELNYAITRALEVNMVLRKLRAIDMPASISSTMSSSVRVEETKPHGNTPPTLFISYSHKDEAFKDELVIMLSSLQRRGIIDAWQDRSIEPGAEWLSSIQTALNECQLAVLLVSGDFLASPFITGSELPELFQRRKTSGMRAVPIIVRDCLWQSEPVLQDLQALPKDGKPIISFSKETGDRDHAWTDIAKAIEILVRKIA